MTSVEALCTGCANRDPKDGGCKLAWVTRRNQEERAKAGYCEDAGIYVGGKIYDTPAVVISKEQLQK